MKKTLIYIFIIGVITTSTIIVFKIEIEKVNIEKNLFIKQEKEKTQEILDEARILQIRAETAIFNKAVGEQLEDWKGYMNYENDYKKISDLLKLHHLDLSSSELFRLPTYIKDCQNLKSINFTNNPDIDVTDCFNLLCHLPNLKKIHISAHTLDNIPERYWEKIFGIDVSQNDLTKIPENILKQKQLVYLDISGSRWIENRLIHLQPKLFELKNLKYLNLSRCNIDTLEDKIGKLANLNKLYLSKNQIRNLPSGIKTLTNLTKLNLSTNQLSFIPPEIDYLINLKELNLKKNNINNIPPSIGNLTNLTCLDLSHNELTTLPTEIGNLISLKILILKNNQLTHIPQEIERLINLIKLNISNNKLSDKEKEKIKKLLPNCKILL
jgi:Leucine-rich repeat (LRR) protein